MANVENWRIYENPRRKKSSAISKPEAVDVILKSRNPVMIVGHLAKETRIKDREMIDHLIDLGETRRIPIIATGKINRELQDRGYGQATIMAAIDVGHRLTDREWRGPDGKGPYDLAIFAGLSSHIEWMILSGLKHSAKHVRTLSLNRNGQYYPGLDTLPHIRGPCSWMSCVGPAQTYRSLVFRPEKNGKTGIP